MSGTIHEAPTGRRASASGWAAVIAWMIAVPVAAFTLVLEWGLARDFGTEDVGQYVLLLPAMLLVAMAAWVTARAAGLSRWAVLAAAASALVMGAAGYGAISWGESERQESIAAACSSEDLEVLASLPVEGDEQPTGYPDGGCYLRYSVAGELIEAQGVLDAAMEADGWTVRSGAPEDPAQPIDPTLYLKDGMELFADVEGMGNLEGEESAEGVTVFRLTLIIPEQ